MHSKTQQILMRAADAVVDRLPQPVPSPARLAQAKIISHRGQHDNTTCMENTIAAFERAAEAGAWGIEMDIRWTSDLQPVVFHDPDLLRLFGTPRRIDDFTLVQLSEQFPSIPALAQVVARFGRQIHLMIEVKQEPWRDQDRQVRGLQEVLTPLAPVRDFHLLTLHPEMLSPFFAYAPTTRVAIAEAWPGDLSRRVLDQGWGGLCGHFLLLHTGMARRHQKRHQAVGTGFVASRRGLFRELNRRIDWIFSNDAVGLRAIVDQANTRGTIL